MAQHKEHPAYYIPLELVAGVTALTFTAQEVPLLAKPSPCTTYEYCVSTPQEHRMHGLPPHIEVGTGTSTAVASGSLL